MKIKQLFLALTLMIFILSVFSCSTANEGQPTTMPKVAQEGASWTLEAFIEGQVTSSLIGDTEITLQFDGGYVRGSAGCNDYGGSYALERGTLSISHIDITEQSCLEPPGIMAQETKYLESLREVTAFIWDANHLTLKTANGPGLRFVSTGPTAVIPPIRANLPLPEWSAHMNLSIKNVSKQYRRDLWGLRDFSLEVGAGVLGLLGPNGAGKSTLMRILATITEKTGGAVTWNGVDIARHPDNLRQVLGYLPQDFGVYPNLNALEFLEYIAAIKGLDGKSAKRRIGELLQLVNLVDSARRPLGGYSGGMKQRVGIAQALLNDPQLLIVDEPTAELDPEERVRFRNLLADLSGERIVILSTHIVSDVEATATLIAIINKGQRIAHAAPETILQAVEGKVWTWVVSSEEFAKLKQSHLISSTARRSDAVHVRVVSEQMPNTDAKPVPVTLEDAYLYSIHRAHPSKGEGRA